MFRNEFKPWNDLLFEGHKLLTKSFLIFGFFLVVLAGLIFMFPAIIGMLFAIFIFLAGLFVLVAGYHFWQTKMIKTTISTPLMPILILSKLIITDPATIILKTFVL